jgi:hypothetical protein
LVGELPQEKKHGRLREARGERGEFFFNGPSFLDPSYKIQGGLTSNPCVD